MPGYSELIKNFEKVRDFARDFFIYGFRGRGDFKSVSSRSYDNERRRIESYLSGHIVKNRDNRGKNISISSNTTAKTSNPMFKIWQTKSFTKRDCFLHFVLLDILSGVDGLSVSQIAEIISRDYEAQLCDTEPVDAMTIRNKLNEYTKLGILKAKKHGKTLNYFLPKNPLERLKPDTYKILFNALQFYKNVLPAGFIGHSINNSPESPFIYRQIFFAQTLDDDIILKILEAIKYKCSINITMAGSSHSRITKARFVPLKILSNTRTGRRYVSVYSMRKNKLSTVRIDYIKDVETGEVFTEFDNIKAEDRMKLENSFSIVHQTTDRLHNVRMVLSIDEKTEGYVLERLKREGRHGVITRLGDNVFEYKIDVSDTLEMVPWLRTFIGRIVEIDGSERNVIKQFKSDISMMASMYCE